MHSQHSQESLFQIQVTNEDYTQIQINNQAYSQINNTREILFENEIIVESVQNDCVVSPKK